MPNLANISQIYPDKPIKKGDSWTKNINISGSIGLNYAYTYTLTDRKAGNAYIDVSAVITPDLESPGMEMMGMKMMYDLAGTASGKIIINEKTGWSDKTDITQDLKGIVKMSGELIGSMESEMEMKTITRTEKIN